jgi:predicted ATP-grasp superfamily ATP-dependent carboligase
MLAGGISKSGYDARLPVLILKSEPRPLHHGTLGAIRSLGRAGVPVYCCTEPGPSPPARSRYLSRDHVDLLSAADLALAITELQRFQQRLGLPLTIIAMDDVGALFLAEAAAALGDGFRLPRQPPGLPREVASKANFPRLCALTGTPTPRTVVVQPTDDLAEAIAAIRYPAVVKIAQPWLLSEGVRAALLVRDLAEAADYRARLADPSAAIVVQDFIPDEAAEDWFYHGYHATGGEAVVGFTGRKLRSYPPFVGATSYGISLVNKKVRSLAQSLLRDLHYAGIVELEFRLDKRDGQYKLIDFNPRLGAQFQFLRNAKGVDVVRAMHLDISGRPVPHAPQVEGNTFVSDFTDMAVFGAYRRRGLVSRTDWLKQMLGADEHAWFAIDDLAPFGAAALRFGARFFFRKSPPARRSETQAAPALSREPPPGSL